MAEVSTPDSFSAVDEYRTALHECREHFRLGALATIREQPSSITGTPEEFLNRMLDLHHGLVLKIFLDIAHVDWKWSKEENRLGAELLEHVWRKRLEPAQVREALQHVLEQHGLTWETLVGPFTRYPAFRERAAALQTDVVRMANLIAKADGRVKPEEVRQLEWIQGTLGRLLRPVSIADEGKQPAGESSPYQQEEQPPPLPTVKEPGQTAKPEPAPASLAEALAELDGLVGLEIIKQEVHGLVNFLKVQSERKRFNLPTAKISLHSVFTGNPGTGKTTVARLLGRLLGAMGIVAKGHLIETDRSGLVAEFAGQTGPKTHKRLDEALDGVLFIDEAYSLIAEQGDDPYGAEAIQALLKRMEDDRERLVVVIAGYPAPMDRMLRSNPGLSSRFSRTFTFPDYTAVELGRIFERMAVEQHYELPPITRVKLLLGFQTLLERRDEHFGNGRLARNVFERAIQRLANRIAGIAPLTRELLTTFEADDVEMNGVDPSAWENLDSRDRRFHVACPQCRQGSPVPADYLVRKMRCKSCSVEFTAGWGEPVGPAKA